MRYAGGVFRTIILAGAGLDSTVSSFERHQAALIGVLIALFGGGAFGADSEPIRVGFVATADRE
jgi:hypothetical protein